MNKIERVQAILRGEPADRPPYSFWHHFEPAFATGSQAVEAHLRHLEIYDLDFLKVMNDHGTPWEKDGLLTSAESLRSIRPYPADQGPFGQQLKVITSLCARLKNELLIATTIFSPWSVLRSLCAPPAKKHGPPHIEVGNDPRDRMLSKLLEEDRPAFEAALTTIAMSLADFARLCLQAGANGVFFSVRDDWVDTEQNGTNTYDTIVRAADMLVCQGIGSGGFNILHVCGRALNFERFAGYPFQVINWADRSAGPAIKDVTSWIRPAICAGLDNLGTLAGDSAEACIVEATDAQRQAGHRPIIIAPGCTYDPVKVRQENLLAVCRALRQGIVN